MFTGLIREIGTLVALRPGSGLTRLTVRAPHAASELAPGDSLAVNGVCLTATALRSELVELDAVDATRRVTTLGDWRPGRRLHLEPALRAGDALGGHLVLGHVDGTGRVRRVERRAGTLWLEFSHPEALDAWLLPKGSIAVDGVSLTLDGAPGRGRFAVNLIPHTVAGTLFGSLRPGDAVNLEADVLAKGAAREAPPGHPPTPKPLSIDRILSRGYRRRS